MRAPRAPYSPPIGSIGLLLDLGWTFAKVSSKKAEDATALFFFYREVHSSKRVLSYCVQVQRWRPGRGALTYGSDGYVRTRLVKYGSFGDRLNKEKKGVFQ